VQNGVFPSKQRFNVPAAPGQAYSAHRVRQQNFLCASNQLDFVVEA
jgi:hypothetical protein